MLTQYVNVKTQLVNKNKQHAHRGSRLPTVNGFCSHLNGLLPVIGGAGEVWAVHLHRVGPSQNTPAPTSETHVCPTCRPGHGEKQFPRLEHGWCKALHLLHTSMQTVLTCESSDTDQRVEQQKEKKSSISAKPEFSILFFVTQNIVLVCWISTRRSLKAKLSRKGPQSSAAIQTSHARLSQLTKRLDQPIQWPTERSEVSFETHTLKCSQSLSDEVQTIDYLCSK